VTLSLVSGTAAGVLAVLTWETLRRSPFGKSVFVLSLVMVLFILYHWILLLVPALPPIAQVVKSALFAGGAVFIWMMVWSQHQLTKPPEMEVTKRW